MLVETKYLPPTNRCGARIAVRYLTPTGWNRRVIAWDYSKDTEANHRYEADGVVCGLHRTPRGTIPYLSRGTPGGRVFIFETDKRC